MLKELQPDTPVLSADGEVFYVSDEIAAAFRPGDAVVADRNAGLLHIPAAELEGVQVGVAACAAAFDSMGRVKDEQIVAFYDAFAERLRDDEIWRQVVAVNATDVTRAQARGRSTTRLEVSDAMREGMVEGLRGWAAMPSRRGAVLETIEHDGFRIEMVGAALGVVAFVFEGRPNVLADACGVLRGGNTVIFRIGSDALATANTLMTLAVQPALEASRLPKGAVTLIDSAAHAAGWALFRDRRLSLAVARGSGPAVELLGSLAQSVGTPVSLHGTGGAWIVAGESADAERFQSAVVRSLDRKVCNTLNTCCIVASRAEELAPQLLNALAEAAKRRNQQFKLHVASGSEHWVPNELFDRDVAVARAEGDVIERQAETIATDALGTEWEWEQSPEITLTVVADAAEASALFNAHSPRLVASLISDDPDEQERFYETTHTPFIGNDHTRWVDGQFALSKPELGLSNWANGRLFGRSGILTGDSVYTVRTRYLTS